MGSLRAARQASCDWLLTSTLHGDDRKAYEIAFAIMSMKQEKSETW